ncbi:hypothetical protein F5I97DRAFT_1923776 [Phlebopus sp. FC_14]|nr:hypothetical protein F5I97DRAFT_1923776 [Phlebopus sp. FC_14]
MTFRIPHRSSSRKSEKRQKNDNDRHHHHPHHHHHRKNRAVSPLVEDDEFFLPREDGRSTFFDPSWNFQTATYGRSLEYDHRRLVAPLPPYQTSHDYEVERADTDHRGRSSPPPPFPHSSGAEDNRYEEKWLGDDSKLCSSPLPVQHSLDLENNDDARRLKNHDHHSPSPSSEPSLPDFGFNAFEEWLDNWDRTARAPLPPSTYQPSRNVKEKATHARRYHKEGHRDRLPSAAAAHQPSRNVEQYTDTCARRNKEGHRDRVAAAPANGHLDEEANALQQYVASVQKLHRAATRLTQAKGKHKPSPDASAAPAHPRYPDNGQVQGMEALSQLASSRRGGPAANMTFVILPNSHPPAPILDVPPPRTVRPEKLAQQYVSLAACNHKFDRSLTLPLWHPSHVKVGSVGYYSARTGNFVTLFNALDIFKLPSGMPIHSAHLYGKFKVQITPHKSLTNQFSLSLMPNTKSAYAFANSTAFSRIDQLDGPKEWLEDHADILVREYAEEHPELRKSTLSFVTSTLNAEDYALFVSTSTTHPESRLAFDVSPTRVQGRPWGSFRAPFLRGAADREGLDGDFMQRVSRVRTVKERKVRPENGHTLMLGGGGGGAGALVVM